MILPAVAVYVAYLWFSRATTLPSLKSCADCKFFLPPIGDLSSDYAVRRGRCALFPYAENTVRTLIPGFDEPVGRRFKFATAARESEDMCGETAVNFVPMKKMKDYGRESDK
jgi:hypothetical protein